MDWAARIAELMWGAGLAAVPVAIVAAVCCRIKSFRPATRHAMWFAVLFTLLSPIVMAGVWRPSWFRSDRVMSVVDSLSPTAAKAVAEEPVPVVNDEPRPVESVAIPRRVDPSLLSSALQRSPSDVSLSRSHWPQAETIDAAPLKAGLTGTQPEATRPALVGLDKMLLTPAPRADATPAEEPRVRTAAPVPLIRTHSTTREWLTQVLAVRDALAAVPSIPPLVWLAGATLVVSFWIARYVLIRRLIRRAEAAPGPMVALVRRLAVVAGVKRVPKTLVVDDRVSPMIVCGLKPRLIIPRALWRELDTKCQCAVIVHELSHLRRRDHRMCWVESLIGLAYWWHPVSWWARRRLRDEAEACCDAWVTTLLPGGRRAYAEALVATKSFLSVPGRSGAPGLGVSGRTRQLARRVTMVMTQRVAPKASVFGLAFAIAIAATGMLVMPGLACPPEEAKAKEEAAKVRAAALNAEKKAKDEARARDGVLFLGEAPALEAMKKGERSRAGSAPSGDPLQDKVQVLRDKERALQDMEKRLREMEAKLQMLQDQGHKPRGATNLAPSSPRAASGSTYLVTPGTPMAIGGLSGALTVPPQPPRVAMVPGQPMPPRAVGVGRGRTVITTPGQAIAGSPQARTSRPGVAIATTQGETVARGYSLPEGKLEALTNLMIRDDVPILVSRDNGKITIHATEQQHEIIGAFIKMINPEGHSALPSRNMFSATTNAEAAKRYAQELHAAAKALEPQKRDSQRQHEQLLRQLERTKEQMQKLRDQHENARGEKDEEGADEGNDPFIIQLDGLECRLGELDCLSERIDSQIEALDCTIETLKEQAENPIEVEGVIIPEPAELPEPPEAPEAAVPALAPSAPTAPALFAPMTGTAAPAMPAHPAEAPRHSKPAKTPAPGLPPVPPTAPVAPAAPASAPAADSVETPSPVAAR